MKALIIGLGSIARKHIEAIRFLRPDTEIMALRSSREAAEMEGIINLHSVDELTDKPDFVIVSNPTSLHYTTISTLIPSGIPLFIEKPSLASLANGKELADRINQNHILTYVACNMRFHPAVQFLKNFLGDYEHRINEVNIYAGSFLPDWRPGRNFREIYSANKEMGGGVHLDLIHELDYTYWLFGKPQEARSTLRSSSSLEICAVDYANYILGYPGFAAGITLNYYRRDSKRIIELLTEKETITADLLNCSVKDNLGNTLFSKEYKPMDTYIAQMDYFINCLENNTAPMNSFAESLEVLDICLGHAETER